MPQNKSGTLWARSTQLQRDRIVACRESTKPCLKSSRKYLRCRTDGFEQFNSGRVECSHEDFRASSLFPCLFPASENRSPLSKRNLPGYAVRSTADIPVRPAEPRKLHARQHLGRILRLGAVERTTAREHRPSNPRPRSSRRTPSIRRADQRHPHVRDATSRTELVRRKKSSWDRVPSEEGEPSCAGKIVPERSAPRRRRDLPFRSDPWDPSRRSPALGSRSNPSSELLSFRFPNDLPDARTSTRSANHASRSEIRDPPPLPS